MKKTFDAAKSRLVATHRRGQTLLLLFNYDGTLAPLASHSRLALLPTEARAVLGRLTRCSRVCLGVTSERRLADLKAQVRLRGLYYAGSSGLELDLRGRLVAYSDGARSNAPMQSVMRRLIPLVVCYPRARLQRKYLGCTVQYGEVDRDSAEELRRRVRIAAEPYSQAIGITQGPQALEIAPTGGWTKATAVRTITAEFEPGCFLPLYAGDREDDRDALDAVASLGGISIGVGPRAPAAEYWTDAPEELAEFLGRLADTLAGRSRAVEICAARFGEFGPSCDYERAGYR